MAFEEQLPEWQNEGTQPPQSKRAEGWLPNEKPPASWFNWLFHRAYKALQELQQKAAEKEEVESVAQAADQAWGQAVLARSIAELHAARHATGGADPLTPEMIGAAPISHGSEHNHDGSDPIPDLVQLKDDYNFHLTDIAAHDITRSATIVIASSTSRNKDQADFVCDGDSDHIELQQALNSLSTSGGRVILLEGIYYFSSFVSFPSNIFVEGQGSSTRIIYPGSSGSSDAVWRIIGQNNCTIKNLVLDGGGESNHSGIRVSNSTNVRLDGVTVRNFAGQFAIRLVGAYNIAFRCLTENNTGSGLELYGDYNLAVGCISRNNGAQGIRAVEVYKNRRLVACISIDNGSHGIDLNPATAVPSNTQTSVIGCLASGNQGYGIYIPNPGMENVIIDGCHLSGNVQGNLLDNGTNTIIGDNYIEGA